FGSMLSILHSFGMFVADLVKSRCQLESENLFLRHQLNIALRRAPPVFDCAGVTGRCWSPRRALSCCPTGVELDDPPAPGPQASRGEISPMSLLGLRTSI